MDEVDKRGGEDVVQLLRAMAAILAKPGYAREAVLVLDLARLAEIGNPAF